MRPARCWRPGRPPGAAQRELIESIYDQSEAMERLVSNLLEMTRLEYGGLQLKKEWQPIQEVIGSALHHMDKRLSGGEVTVSAPA